MAEKLKIVAIPFPLQGHINPMLQLCYQLINYGIDIIFVNSLQNHEKLFGSASSVSQAGSAGTITFVGITCKPVPESCDGTQNEFLNACISAVNEMAGPLEQLITKLNDIRCLISDGYLGWSHDVATKLGIPRVALWTSNVAYHLANHHLPLLIQKGYAARKENAFQFDEDELVTCIPGVKPLHPRDLPTVLHYDSDVDPGFAKRIDTVHKMKQASWILVNSLEEIEMDEVVAMRHELGKPQEYITVGPLLVEDRGSRKSLWKEDETCFRWLDAQEPKSVLYISFGSIVTISVEQIQYIIQALQETRQPFIWAARSNLFSSKSDCFNEFVKRTREDGQGIVVQWAPQMEVLKHSSIGGHLSHCGWNSVMESMIAGVPILGWPFIAEQTMNCKRITNDWGIGLSFKRDNDDFVSAVEVSRVIRKLFHEEEGMLIRQRVEQLTSVVQGATQPKGSSQRNLDKFVNAVKHM